MSDSILWTMGDDILQAAVAGMDVGRRPDRQIVVAGPDFAHDKCSFVAVELVRQYTSRPRQTGGTSDRSLPAGECVGQRVAEYQVTVSLDCQPTIQGKKTPTAAETNAASRLVLTDGWDAKVGVHDAIVNGTLFASCQDAQVGDLVPYGPQGGEAGVRFPVLVKFS